MKIRHDFLDLQYVPCVVRQPWQLKQASFGKNLYEIFSFVFKAGFQIMIRVFWMDADLAENLAILGPEKKSKNENFNDLQAQFCPL